MAEALRFSQLRFLLRDLQARATLTSSENLFPRRNTRQLVRGSEET